jgi:hypothetical protein
MSGYSGTPLANKLVIRRTRRAAPGKLARTRERS